MFLLLNAITASLDGLIIGISLRLNKTKLSKKNIITILTGNICIYTFFILLYYYLKLTFMTKAISTGLYLYLAYHSFKEENNPTFNKSLNFLECLLITITHSLDGTIVSLNLVYNYSIISIISLFSFMSIFILLAGYYSANSIKNTKKSNYISTFLFLILALLNLFC